MAATTSTTDGAICTDTVSIVNYTQMSSALDCNGPPVNVADCTRRSLDWMVVKFSVDAPRFKV